MAEEMSTHAIARATGMSRSTVRDALHKAMAKLRKDKVLQGLYEASLYKEHERAVRQSGSTASRIFRSLRPGGE